MPLSKGAAARDECRQAAEWGPCQTALWTHFCPHLPQSMLAMAWRGRLRITTACSGSAGVHGVPLIRGTDRMLGADAEQYQALGCGHIPEKLFAPQQPGEPKQQDCVLLSSLTRLPSLLWFVVAVRARTCGLALTARRALSTLA